MVKIELIDGKLSITGIDLTAERIKASPVTQSGRTRNVERINWQKIEVPGVDKPATIMVQICGPL